MPKDRGNLKRYLELVVVTLLISGFALFGFLHYKTRDELKARNAELVKARADFEEAQMRFQSLLEERNYIYNNLLSEQAKNELFENQINEIAGTVGRLDELSKTDRELLQKYSKVYFLNEHYTPDSLVSIPPEYVYEKSRKLEIHSKIFPYFKKMMDEAKAEGVDLLVISAFRSFGEQGALKNTYLVNYGSGANQFSADQGYSEHQLGTAIDLTTKGLGAGFTDFAETEEYEWLAKNAYRYGFILSYPKNNTYYQFEPWHWRFVGKALALRMHEEGEHFYDLPQNKIDAYLINIFD